MKKILVITDLSANSKAGIKFGLQLAAQTGCDLELYHLVEIMKPTSWNDKRFASFSARRISEIDSDIRGQVAAAGAEAGHDGRLFHIKIEIGTKVAEKAIAYAKKTRAGFICLGTRGEGKIKKLLGSNAIALLTTSPVPVIVVPPSYHASALTSVMYASDFENLGPEIKKAKTFAAELGAGLTVYHYNRQLAISDDIKALERKAARYATDHTTFVYRKLDIDRTLPELLTKDIRSKKPSILALFARPKRGWLNRLFSPGNSARMALSPIVPMLVFRKK